jgi:hypothetical protein
MSKDKALDLIGIKGLSDSVRIAAKGVLDGAALRYDLDSGARRVNR